MGEEAIDTIVCTMNDMMQTGTPNTIFMSPQTPKMIARATMRKREYRRWRGRIKADYRRWLITRPAAQLETA